MPAYMPGIVLSIRNMAVSKKVKREREISEDKWKGKIQNLWDAPQRALTGKFTAIYVHLKLKSSIHTSKVTRKWINEAQS